MNRLELIRKVKHEMSSERKGCGCKKKDKFEEKIMENPCQEGYIAYGTKIKDGREVPNCIPEEEAMKKGAYVVIGGGGADPGTRSAFVSRSPHRPERRSRGGSAQRPRRPRIPAMW